jgi:hypothetical protein
MKAARQGLPRVFPKFVSPQVIYSKHLCFQLISPQFSPPEYLLANLERSTEL